MRLIAKAYIQVSNPTETKFPELLLMIIDQSAYRSTEWGKDLIRGQFESVELPFTKENLSAFETWLTSPSGKRKLKKLAKDYEMTSDELLDPDFGVLGSESFKTEKELAN
jgi:hypothetical protein